MAAKVRWREDRGAWYLFVYANGAEVKQRFGPRPEDRRRAERKAREIERALANGKLGLEKRERVVPFDAFAAEWYRAKVELPRERGLEHHLAKRTAELREQQIRLHLVPFFGAQDLRRITVQSIDELWTQLLDKRQIPQSERANKRRQSAPEPPARTAAKGLSRRSLEIVLGTLRMLLADAVAKGIVAANAVDHWKAVQPKGRAAGKLRPIDQAKVLDAAEREHLLATAERVAPEHFAFVLFLAETGCRIGEAIALSWSEVELDFGLVRLHRTKTGGQPTDVELSDRLRHALRAHRSATLRAALERGEGASSAHGGSVFRNRDGGPIDAENFRRRVWAPLLQAAWKGERYVTPHALRHSWATLHLAHGTPLKWIQDQGGWASSKMLLDVYGHFLPRQMRGFANALAAGRTSETEASDRPTPTQRVAAIGSATPPGDGSAAGSGTSAGVPGASRTRDLLLRRQIRPVAAGGSVLAEVAISCAETPTYKALRL